MNSSTINGTSITLKLTSNSSPVAGTVGFNTSTNTATFTPTSALSPSTNYTLSVSTVVADAAGNTLASSFSSTFSTVPPPDLTPPSVTAVTPVAATVGVLRNGIVTVTFSEPMNAATISGSNVTVKITTTNAAVAGALAYDVPSKTATFTPTVLLAYNTDYTVTVTTGVQDLAGNPLSSLFTSTFRTIQDMTGFVFFQGTNEITDTTEAQVHVHIRFTQDGQTLGRPADCQPMPLADCEVLPRNSAGKVVFGPATPGEPADAIVMSAITGTITDPGVTFTFTLTNGRSFTFTGTVTNSNAMTGTLSGATLAPVQILLTRGG